MKKKLFGFLSVLFFFCQTLSAQIESCVDGFTLYDLTIKNIPYTGKVYLRSSSMDEYQIIDSAVVKKGKARLRTKKVWIPQGVYTIVNEDHRYQLPVILNSSTSFTILTPGSSQDPVSIIGSEENEALYNFLHRARLGKVAPQELTVALETAPDSYLDRVKAIFYFSRFKQEIDTQFFSLWTRYYNFKDARALHTSTYFFRTLAEYLSDYEVSNADKRAVIDNILHAGNICTRDAMLAFIFNTIDDLRDPYYDELLLHVYDDFDKAWVPEDRARMIARKMDRIRRITPGAQIPELISHDIDGKAHSTKDIATRYTILWFWDPDCDHCQEMTPILHKMYHDLENIADFEVFAVEVNEDYDRWKAFSDQHNLWDWINLSTSMGEANVDFIDYFDIMTTPVIFLIDNTSSTIIKRQITLEELETFLKQHPNSN